jgi:hypothetical protein
MTRLGELNASKVPEVTLVFWIIKIAATTLGGASLAQARLEAPSPQFRRLRIFRHPPSIVLCLKFVVLPI